MTIRNEAERRECYALMERELDEAIAYAVAHPEVLAAVAEGTPVRNAMVEGGSFEDDTA